LFIFYQPQEQVQEELPRLKEQIGEIQDRELGREIIDFIQTVLLYKFINLSQEEMEAMFSLSDLKKAGFIKRLGRVINSTRQQQQLDELHRES